MVIFFYRFFKRQAKIEMFMRNERGGSKLGDRQMLVWQ